MTDLTLAAPDKTCSRCGLKGYYVNGDGLCLECAERLSNTKFIDTSGMGGTKC